MSGSYLAVAVDHRSSFDEYLAAASSTIERGAAKRRLVELVCDKVDALVVESRHRPSWALEWPKQVWWGAPDQLVQPDTPHGHMVETLDLNDLDLSWLAGVKLGVNAAGPGAWRRACSEISNMAKVAAANNFTIVFEPYFTGSDDQELRAEVLENMTNLPEVEYSKLEVYSSDLLKTYTEKSHVPWLARSDGRRYDEYVGSLKEAVLDGCGGCMIGAALWADVLGAIDENASLLKDRIMELRSILALQPVTSAVQVLGGQMVERQEPVATLEGVR
jgi:hypothetical protein